MTGRGVDQILRHPSPPAIQESLVKDARDYVALAEKVNGEVPRGVDDAYIWPTTTSWTTGTVACSRPSGRW